MGESGTEAVDEIAQREVAFEEIFVIILDVIGQLAHERCVDLLEPAQGITAGIKHVVVADLPPFQLGALPGPLFAANLDRFRARSSCCRCTSSNCRSESSVWF